MGKFDFDKINEAFKAGNAARKKESAQDAVQSVAVHGWNPDEMESLWDDMTFKSGFSSEDIDAVNGKFSCHLEMNPLDFDIELSIAKYDGRTAELYMDIRSSNQGWEFESFTGSCNNMENLFRWADNWARDTIEELNEHAAMYEAFKAGNRARKKESAQDAAAETDPMQSRVNFKDPYLRKAMEWGGIVTMQDCFDEDDNHLGEIIEYTKQITNGRGVQYFPEFEFFDNVQVIKEDWFKKTYLEEIKFHDRLVIEYEAFLGTRLKEVILDGELMELRREIFCNCQNLTKVVISTAIEISSRIFSHCGNLSDVTFDMSYADMYNRSFNIPMEMFSNCEKLSRIDLPEGLENIGDEAFYLTDLRTLIIPKTVKRIGRAAFRLCRNLKSVRFLGDYCELDNGVFDDCINLRDIRANSQMFRYLHREHRYLLERAGVPKGVRLLLD